MTDLEKQLVEVSEKLIVAKLISKLMKAGLDTNDTKIIQFINNFTKDNE